jgi:hypothetical protein
MAFSPSATMQTQLLTAFNQPYQLTTLPLPSPANHDLLIEVGAASYCHTDFIYASGAMGGTLALISCHEFAGTIVSTGPLAFSVTLPSASGPVLVFQAEATVLVPKTGNVRAMMATLKDTRLLALKAAIWASQGMAVSPSMRFWMRISLPNCLMS